MALGSAEDALYAIINCTAEITGIKPMCMIGVENMAYCTQTPLQRWTL